MKEKLIENINIDSLTGCWIWQRGKNHDGYGYLWWQDKMHRAHRASYEVFVGPIGAGLLVLHKCDNRACINPEHLFLGTHRDNALDRNSKGRQTKGDSHPNAKITYAKVLEYKTLKTSISQESGARYSSKAARERLGIPKTITDHIDSGRRWQAV